MEVVALAKVQGREEKVVSGISPGDVGEAVFACRVMEDFPHVEEAADLVRAEDFSLIFS